MCTRESESTNRWKHCLWTSSRRRNVSLGRRSAVRQKEHAWNRRNPSLSSDARQHHHWVSKISPRFKTKFHVKCQCSWAVLYQFSVQFDTHKRAYQLNFHHINSHLIKYNDKKERIIVGLMVHLTFHTLMFSLLHGKEVIWNFHLKFLEFYYWGLISLLICALCVYQPMNNYWWCCRMKDVRITNKTVEEGNLTVEYFVRAAYNSEKITVPQVAVEATLVEYEANITQDLGVEVTKLSSTLFWVFISKM